MDVNESTVDEVRTSKPSKSNEKALICGAQKLRNFFANLRRNNFEDEDDSVTLSYDVERKLSSGFSYKLKDEKSDVKKTLWPVTCREYLFLPEYKVRCEELEEKFEIINYIAKGSFGKVYKVKRLEDSKIFALKVFEKSKIILDDYQQQLKYEVVIQKAISHHPFITSSYERWQNKGFVYQLSEFISKGEIFETIKIFTNKLIQFYIAELAIVIDFLHNAGIIYRDLKSENILLDENYHIKLTDFGLSKWLKLGQRTYTICGTRSSMAPEIFAGEGYSHAVDWYALGVLASKMMCNHQQNGRESEDVFKDFDQVDDARCAIDENETKLISETGSKLSDASNDLLRRMLEKNPQHRLKSLLALQRIAFYLNYNFDDVRYMKISPRKLIEDENLLKL
ncbi:CLUMA_CG017369, isoform A [Clunio marinus]|uniref:CLUMA_CG017369, isoform A n=1 Tax=Clunio marinus TaxID=568069 RepID=A0A1J1IVR7_9DIPT|nr:CLUMA_CG017369, isoform A [Clunio marinus]